MYKLLFRHLDNGMDFSHVLVVAGSLVLLVRGDDQLVPGADRVVLIVNSVPCADLWSFLP